eukprot:12021729-Ditylum_brightwellii.AAC.1
MRIPIVHAALKYECPYTGEASILVVRNALHVPKMENNLIPPFIMREVGLQVSDTPKIHIKDPTVDNHAITPTKWNPHCDSFAKNEEYMLDWEGNIIDKKDR